MSQPPVMPPKVAPPIVPAEKVAQAEALLTELEMLREFFDCWEALHRLAKQVAVPRRMKENAAQRLVDAADTVRSFRNPVSDPSAREAVGPKLEVVKS